MVVSPQMKGETQGQVPRPKDSGICNSLFQISTMGSDAVEGKLVNADIMFKSRCHDIVEGVMLHV